MSETRRTVSVEIVYDGDACGSSCPFLYDMIECKRFGAMVDDGERCDECKAEDKHAFTVVPADGSPQYTVTITPNMASKMKRELSENKAKDDFPERAIGGLFASGLSAIRESAGEPPK